MKPETAQHALKVLLSNISEDIWRAGWYHGLEYLIWADVQRYATVSDEPLKYLQQFEAEAIYDLVTEAGGWIYWPQGANEETFIPMENWRALYAAWANGKTCEKAGQKHD